MKELFLITSHTPDQRREDILHNFVNKLQDYDYDIMICTHCPIPTSIANKVDYVLYEKQNKLLTKPDEKFLMWYQIYKRKIFSSEITKFNHTVAIGRSLGLGLKTAKDMGYEKVHYFEYDTDFNSLKEIEENSKLLDKFSIVYYDGHAGPNVPLSLNINNISKNWFKYDYENLTNFVKNDLHKTIENYERILIDETGNSYRKNVYELSSRGIHTAQNSSIDENPWNVFFVDDNNQFNFFGDNSTNNMLNITIIINHNNSIQVQVHPNTWNIKPLGDFNQVNSVYLFINGELKRSYTFDDESREIFKKYNYIQPIN